MADQQTQDRTPREIEQRDAAKRPMTWKPAGALPTPKPTKDWTFRWIRRSAFGSEDPTNMSKKFREGWEPVSPKDHPEMAMFVDPRKRGSQELIEVGGLILARMPAEMAEARRRYYADMSGQQMQAIDQQLANEQTDSRMPIYNERRTKVSSFGRGS